MLGEPHCQPEAPGAEGGLLSPLDNAGMQAAAILLLLWPYSRCGKGSLEVRGKQTLRPGLCLQSSHSHRP